MDLNGFTEKVRSITDKNTVIKDSTLKFVVDEGVVFVDTHTQPNTVSNEDKTADCAIHLSLSNASELLDGKMNVAMAFMMGKMKVKGDMGVAMKVAQLLSK
ncbi:MAG: sterol-binding protein [Bacteroidetes bacterium]|nr:MAG: sterol-binding protein [Bacteroidota bacterium]